MVSRGARGRGRSVLRAKTGGEHETSWFPWDFGSRRFECADGNARNGRQEQAAKANAVPSRSGRRHWAADPSGSSRCPAEPLPADLQGRRPLRCGDNHLGLYRIAAALRARGMHMPPGMRHARRLLISAALPSVACSGHPEQAERVEGRRACVRPATLLPIGIGRVS